MPKDLVDQPAPPHTETPFQSFFRKYFNTKFLVALGGALLLTLPIYFQLFPITPAWVPWSQLGDFLQKGGEWRVILRELLSFLSLAGGFYLLLRWRFSPFWLGFLLSLLWFHWVGFSFIYYNFDYLVPVVIIGMGVGYGILFWIVGKIGDKFAQFLPSSWREYLHPFWWGSAFLLLPFFAPFTFDWLQFQPLLTTTPFPPLPLSLGILIFGIALLTLPHRWGKIAGFFTLLGLFLLPVRPLQSLPPVKLLPISTDIPQNFKWERGERPREINAQLQAISLLLQKREIELVVTPETSFPLSLNLHRDLVEILSNLSRKGAILVGSLYQTPKGQVYNVGYLFGGGRLEKVLKKHILVPFGEYIPLPLFQKEINKIFFGDDENFASAPQFARFQIANTPFFLAICYELTSQKLYQTPGPTYIVGIANNGWFYLPNSNWSIEPILQRLIAQYYSYRYGKVIYITTNRSGSYLLNRGRVEKWEGVEVIRTPTGKYKLLEKGNNGRI